jgi:tetratricopeptide (TPR) repeat protein
MCVTARPFRIESGIAVYMLAALLLPFLAQGQCDSAAKPAINPQSSTVGQPEFFDEPQFTVAGVTDPTNLGGHGSDTRMRTADTLARDTASLGKPSPGATAVLSSQTEKSLREAVARQPGSFEVNHGLGELLARSGQPRDAIPYLERASQLRPTDYKNAFQLASAYANAGDYERSRDHVRTLMGRQDKAELHHLLANIEARMGNPLEAIRQYQRAAEMDPSEPNLFDWGSELLAHHAAEPALEVFAKGNRLFPQSVRMLVGMGAAWYARGFYERAANHFCRASDLNPKDPSPYLFLGKIESAESVPSEGMLERMERFARLAPDNALANYYYALSLWKRRKAQDTALETQVQSLLERAVRLDPKLGAGYLQLGVLYSDRKDFRKAISAYQKAIAVSPRLEEAHYRLAQAYRQTGEPQKAQQETQLYKQLSKESAEEATRQRREMQQFVYTLRDGSPAQPPQPQ